MSWFELIGHAIWMAVAVIIILVSDDMDGDESEG